MAAFDYQHGKRPHSLLHDMVPLLVVAVICFIVVAWNIKL